MLDDIRSEACSVRYQALLLSSSQCIAYTCLCPILPLSNVCNGSNERCNALQDTPAPSTPVQPRTSVLSRFFLIFFFLDFRVLRCYDVPYLQHDSLCKIILPSSYQCPCLAPVPSRADRLYSPLSIRITKGREVFAALTLSLCYFLSMHFGLDIFPLSI